MRVIKPSFTILGDVDGTDILKSIERAGRVCYKSEDKITDDSAAAFVTNIIKRGHESVLEHERISVHVICDRGVSHEIVRHRLASYCQESTRYCNYSNTDEITVIEPCFWPEDDHNTVLRQMWYASMLQAEQTYLTMIQRGAQAQEARSVLPNSLKTEIVMTMNLREWRHFFKLRTAKAAHPQMREIAVPMLAAFKELVPVVFDDINAE